MTIDVWLPSVGVKEAWSKVNTHMATAEHDRQGQAGFSTYAICLPLYRLVYGHT